MRITALMTAALIGFLPNLGSAEIKMVDYGVVCEVILTNKRAAEGTESGLLNVIGPGRNIDVTTRRVPAELGLSFGMRVALASNTAAQAIRVEVTHPPMGSRGITRQRWSASVQPGETFLNLFSFEQDHELVQGRWRFKLTSAGGKTLTQDFTVSTRYDVPAVQQACYGGSPTS